MRRANVAGMRTAMLFSLATVLLLAGCESAHDRLQGKWEFDPESLERLPFFQNLPAEQQDQILRYCVGTMTFHKDKVVWDLAIHNWLRTKGEKSYTVDAQDGNRITLHLDDAQLGPRLVVTATQKRMQFALAGRSFLFRRPKK